MNLLLRMSILLLATMSQYDLSGLTSKVDTVTGYVDDIQGDVTKGVKEPLCTLQTELESKIKDISDNIPHIVKITTIIVPEVNKIQSIVSEVTNIPSIVRDVSNIPSIATGISTIIPSISPHITQIDSIIPTIKRELDDIPGDILREIRNNIVPTITSEINSIPYISIIPTVVPTIRDTIREIPPTITDAIVPPIVDTIKNIPPLIVDEILPIITDQVLPIVTDEILPAITDTIENLISQLFNGTFSFAKLNGEAISLGNTLKVCVDDLLDAAFGDIPIPFEIKLPFDLPGLSDPELILFQVAAIPLLPFKSQVEFFCINSIDKIKTALNIWKHIPFIDNENTNDTQRRRNLEDKPCEEDSGGFCAPAEYDFSAASSGWDWPATHVRLWLQRTLVAVGCFKNKDSWQTYCFLSTKYTWIIVEEILPLIKYGVKRLCRAFKGTSIVQVNFVILGICENLNTGFEWITRAVKKIQWAIDFHDAIVDGVRKSAWEKNRLNIIHNQYALKKMIGEIFLRENNLDNKIQSHIESEENNIQNILGKLANIEKLLLLPPTNRSSTAPTPSPTSQPTSVHENINTFNANATFGANVDVCHGVYFDIQSKTNLSIKQFEWTSRCGHNDYKIYISKGNKFTLAGAQHWAWTEPKLTCEGYANCNNDIDQFNTVASCTFYLEANNKNKIYIYSDTGILCGLNPTTQADQSNSDLEVFAGKAGAEPFEATTDAVFIGYIGYHVGTPAPSFGFRARNEADMKVDMGQNEEDVVPETNANLKESANLVIIQLGLKEIYIFVSIFIAYGLVLLVMGIVIGKYVFGYKSARGFTPVPKYDYATSDVEDDVK
eukprot:544921_1